MTAWLPAAALTDCPPGSALEVVVADRVIALYNVAGEIYALDGICPHQGGPLGKGTLHGCVATCPWHGWQYDVRSGQHQSIPSLVQPPIPVKCEDGRILVALES